MVFTRRLGELGGSSVDADLPRRRRDSPGSRKARSDNAKRQRQADNDRRKSSGDAVLNAVRLFLTFDGWQE